MQAVVVRQLGMWGVAELKKVLAQAERNGLCRDVSIVHHSVLGRTHSSSQIIMGVV